MSDLIKEVSKKKLSTTKLPKDTDYSDYTFFHSDSGKQEVEPNKNEAGKK